MQSSDEPSESTTIKVEIGLTPAGRPIVADRRVETRYRDHFRAGTWQDLSAADQKLATAMIRDIHAAWLTLQSLPFRQSALAKEILLTLDKEPDAADEPTVIYAAIREAIRRTDGTTVSN
jgi:hypothetical protein